MHEFTAADVAIGVPGYNDPNLLDDCLMAIIETVPDGTPIAYADDCSEQPNVERVREMFPFVEVFANERWHGSPFVRNQIYAWADGLGRPLACLIDMDVIVQPGWLDALLAVMNAQPWCWLATFPQASFEPRDRWLDPGSTYKRVEEVGWLCALTRLRTLHECPSWPSPEHGTFGMDERLRGASHDSELCQRVNHDSPWRAYLADEDLVEHRHGGYHSGKGVKRDFVRDSREESRGVWGHIMGEREWFGTFPSSTPPPEEPPA